MFFEWCQVVVTLLFAILVIIDGGYIKKAHATLKDVKRLLEKCEKHDGETL
jgi:uncharacterized protein YoxC